MSKQIEKVTYIDIGYTGFLRYFLEEKNTLVQKKKREYVHTIGLHV